MGSLKSTPCHIKWQLDKFSIILSENENGTPYIQFEQPLGSGVVESLPVRSSQLPLVSVKLAGEGNTADKTAKALVGSYLSQRLRYAGHEFKQGSSSKSLEIRMHDPISGISIKVELTNYQGTSVIRSTATIKNEHASQSMVVTQLSCLTVGGMTTSSVEWWNQYKLLTATNGWFREAQWREQSLPDIGIDKNGILELHEGHSGSQATFSLSNRGSFSSGSYLPMGLLTSGNDTWMWQIESNGSWRWEIGDFQDAVYLSAGGPTSVDHGWKKVLQPEERFTTVPVACCRVSGGVEKAFTAMNQYRRAMRRPHPDLEKMPIIFNDYMNCLMGDPNEDKIEALIEPAAQSGAEYFVIDAGWYADDNNWWDDVGLWEPSKKRFPSGFKKLLDKIHFRGLTPGLWLEPEVVGVRSIVGKRLPEKAFFHEDGERVIERGRFQLDYRCEEVQKWMHSVIHNLVVNLGVGYFKFDYNIEVTYGTDLDGIAPGVAHLEHQRAYLSWVEELLDRYPNLVIENCSSGAQRLDYAMLRIHPLQSTSDQQDPTLYAAITASMPTAVCPEQSATWAYPQSKWDDELNVLTVVNSLLGRVHLSGRLDHLSQHQLDLVIEGMDVYKAIRQDLRVAQAVWPLGLPKWHDDWICLGMVTPENTAYLSVWRRAGATKIDIPLTSLASHVSVSVELLYPSMFSDRTDMIVSGTILQVQLPPVACARLFKVTFGKDG